MKIAEILKFRGVTLCSSIFCVLLITLLQVERLNALKNTSDRHLTLRFSQQDEIITGKLALWQHLPAFGFNNVVADWIFSRFLQYFGDDDARSQNGYSLSPEFFAPIIAHDPYYVYTYLFLSGSTTLYAGMPEKSVALIADGLKSLGPNAPAQSYMVWRYRGTDELLFLGDTQAAQRSFTNAAIWAQQSSYPDAPQVAEMSLKTAQFLANKPASKNARISAWANILSSAFDKNARRLAIDKIQSLGGRIVEGVDGNITVQYPREDEINEENQ